MKRMLINATQHEELRVAIVDGQTLYDLDIESPSREQKKSNIYKGRITRIEPSLEAAFVDFGAERHGFLPMKEVAPQYYRDRAKSQQGRVPIKEALKEGQEIIVQVEKEERGNKGAALTTYISLAGRYLVLMPNNPKAGGVSRRISGEDRQIIRDALQQLEVEDQMGLIVRTAGVGRDLEELQWDLDYLHQVWSAIDQAANERKAPFLIYQEGKLIIRALRDYLRGDIGEILVDDQQTFADAQEFMQQVMPHNLRKLKQYEDAIPLFSRFQIESQIETAFAREVRLPSGGSLAIDHTEALLAIDINSARATKGADIEETAYHTNLEAADEIARQLRIRDLGGLVVIDFIDMSTHKHQRDVEDRLRHALRLDRARVQIGRISRFGLMEMSRQRLRPSLEESIQEVCPRCSGHGRIRGIESLALSVLRLLEEEVMKEQTGQVVAYVPNDVGNFLLNEKRHAIALIEQRHRVPVMVIINQYLETPNFEIQRIRRSDLRLDSDPSYELINQPEAAEAQELFAEAPKADQPAVVSVTPAQPAPPSAKAQPEANGKGLVGWLKGLFVGDEEPEAPKPARKKTQRKKATRKKQSSARGQNRGDAQSDSANRKRSGKPGQKKTGKKKTAKKASKKTAKKSTAKAGDEQRSDGAEARAKKPKRRGRRGGRRRGGQNKPQDQAAAGNQAEKGHATDATGNSDDSTKQERPPRRRRRKPKQSQGADSQTARTPSGHASDQGGATKANDRPKDTRPSENSAPQQPAAADQPRPANHSAPASAPKADKQPAPAPSDRPSGPQPSASPSTARPKPTVERKAEPAAKAESSPSSPPPAAPAAPKPPATKPDGGSGSPSSAGPDTGGS